MSGAKFMVWAVVFMGRVLSRRRPAWHLRGSAAVGRFLAWSAVVTACLTLKVWAASPQTFGTDPAYLINTFGTDDGLPENSATAMVQSADGYLWFGTFEGLVRFNGVDFTVFTPRNTPELPSAGIVNLHLDRSGRLWVSTYEGLVLGQAQAAPRFKAVDGWPGGFVRTFAERPNGDLLITSFDGHVFEFSDGRLRELPSPPGKPGQGYHGSVDEDGHWWVVQAEFVGRWEQGAWRSMVAFQEGRENGLGCTTARDGGIWLLLGSELRRVRRGVEEQRIPLPESPVGVWSLTQDSQGVVWITSHRQGLWRVTPDGEMTQLNAANGGSDQVRFVFEDRERTVWIGTSGDGLMRLTARRFRHMELIEGRKGLAVRSVSADRAGGIWAATYGRGLFHVGAEGAGPVTLLDRVDGAAYLQSVLSDHTGRLWVGILDRAVQWVDGTQVRSVPKEVVGGSNPIALFEDSRGRTWIGAGGDAVAVFDGHDFRRFSVVGDSRQRAITCFAEDSAGVLWAANDGCVFRWDGGSSIVEVMENGHSVGGITSLKADPEGSIWMGSSDRGLLRWKAGQFSVVDGRHGFPVDPILAIMEDDLGCFWMTSNRRLIRARRSDLHAAADGGGVGRLDWQIFDSSDGLPNAEFTRGRQPAGTRDVRGHLWFATSRGVVTVDPSKLRPNDQPPPVCIESLAYLRPAPEEPGQGVARGITEQVLPEISGRISQPISLPSGSRQIEVHYAALSLVAPAKVRYQIKLEGHDDGWQDAGNRRIAYYHDLPPRDYVFRVRAANNDGVWNETGASLAFLVQPFYWQTGWFRILAWMGSLGGVGGGVWAVMRSKLRRQAERLAHERALSQAREQLSHLTRVAILGELSGSLAHELNQPLTAILSNAQAALRFLKSGSVNLEELREILEDIAADDQRAGEVIRRLRLLLKRGEVQLEPLDLNQVARETLELVQSDLVTRNVALVSELESQLPMIQGDRVQLQQVFLNLILNGCDAISEHASMAGRLIVRTHLTDGRMVQVSVSDSGPGIPPDQLERIFEPFVTTKRHGLGLGLAISRNIVEAHGGQLKAVSHPKGGATFFFVLPCGEGGGGGGVISNQ